MWQNKLIGPFDDNYGNHITAEQLARDLGLKPGLADPDGCTTVISLIIDTPRNYQKITIKLYNSILYMVQI